MKLSPIKPSFLLGENGSVDVFSQMGTHIIFDIVGYFFDTFESDANKQDRFSVSGTVGTAGSVVEARNLSNADNAVGIVGIMTSTAPRVNSAGVRGVSSGTAANGIGVWGSHQAGGIGVFGGAGANSIGVRGFAPVQGLRALSRVTST
jgi:hypothetical protein